LRTVLVIALALILLATAAEAEILLNLRGNLYGDYPREPAYTLTLSAGTWCFDLVSPATNPNATYWAWNPWSSGGVWHTKYTVHDGSTRYTAGLFNSATDRQTAFWATHSSNSGALTITLPQQTTVFVGICDYPVGDNQGGLSILVTPVPEPSSWLALAGGVGAIFALRRRR
jgi:hypothetical protein